MRQKRWRILILAAMLVLAGCSNGKNGNGNKTDATSVYETKNMKLNTNVMAVGEEEVTLNEWLFYMYQIKSAYDGSLTTDVWNFKWNGEESIESYAKEEILKEITQIKVICQQAKVEQCVLTEEESNEAKVKAKEYVEALPDDATEYNLTESLVEKIYLEHALAKKMYDVVAGTVDTNVTDEGKTLEDKEKMILERETEAFSKAYQSWKKDYKVVVSSTLLDQIPFDSNITQE